MEAKSRFTTCFWIVTEIFGSLPSAKASSVYTAILSNTMDGPRVCPVIPQRFSSKTERESYGLGRRTDSIAFATRELLRFQHWKAWGTMQPRACSPTEMAASGLQTPAPSTTLLMVVFRPFAAAVVFRAIRLHRCFKTVPAICGSEWMTGYTSSRMVNFIVFPSRINSHLG